MDRLRLNTLYPDLVRRARLRHGRLDPEAREEAVAETLAYTARSVHAAADRGTLDRLSPSTCVYYAAKHVERGRRVAGYSTQCPLSEAGRQKHDHRAVSLDRHAPDDDRQLHQAIADPKGEPPFEAVRRRLDYPVLLHREAVSGKARATLHFLAETHGSGKQTHLAAELMVTPARITQLKGELADALAGDGYHSPLGRRPA